MTIDGAIKFLENELGLWQDGERDNWSDALRLGIEALRRIKDARTDEMPADSELLPGETEE